MAGFSTRTLAQKIGYVNMQDIVGHMPELANVDSSLKKFQTELGGQNQAMQKELQTKYEAYVKDSSTMSDVIKEARQGELRDLQNRMMEFQQGAQDRIQDRQNTLLKPVIDKAQNAVQEVAKAKGYTYVIDNSSNILIASPSGDDLTTQVKTKLGLK
ncbi:hypothetical protein GCM10023143_19250 [Compostibacter hankyongensis]|uniref:OmpH family outer membrane protein n=2 Tax=Compostibacter hankyongensis TaxID=1007089 RepID=A0ABP8FTW4_9BACT